MANSPEMLHGTSETVATTNPASRPERNPENCIEFHEFGSIGPDGLPEILHKITSLLTDKITNEKNWRDQLEEALSEGYYPAEDIRELFAMETDEYELIDILMIWHWFFRGVSACDGEPTLEYRTRNMTRKDRLKGNSH